MSLITNTDVSSDDMAGSIQLPLTKAENNMIPIFAKTSVIGASKIHGGSTNPHHLKFMH